MGNRVAEYAKNHRFVRTPRGRIDLQGEPMTAEEWRAETTRHDPLDRSMRRQRRFDEPEAALDGLLLFRESGIYYLINRSGRPIHTLTYRTVVADLANVVSAVDTYRINDLPVASYVRLQSAEKSAQRSTSFTLQSVVWGDDSTSWTGRRMLTINSPVTVCRRMENMPEDEVDWSPLRIET